MVSNDDIILKAETLKEVIRKLQIRGLARKLLRRVTINGQSITIAKREDAIAAFVPECGEIPLRADPHLEKILVIPYKIADRRLVSVEALEDAGIDLVKEELYDIAIAMQNKEDQDFINCLLIGANHTILFELHDCTPTAPQDDFTTGVSPCDPAFIASVTRERPLLDDVVSAIRVIEEHGGKPDYLIINPREAEDLRRRDELSEALSIYGMTVVITNLIDPYFSLVIDSKNVGLFIERREPTVAMARDFENDSLEIVVSERVSPVCINGDMAVRITRDV